MTQPANGSHSGNVIRDEPALVNRAVYRVRKALEKSGATLVTDDVRQMIQVKLLVLKNKYGPDISSTLFMTAVNNMFLDYKRRRRHALKRLQEPLGLEFPNQVASDLARAEDRLVADAWGVILMCLRRGEGLPFSSAESQKYARIIEDHLLFPDESGKKYTREDRADRIGMGPDAYKKHLYQLRRNFKAIVIGTLRSSLDEKNLFNHGCVALAETIAEDLSEHQRENSTIFRQP